MVKITYKVRVWSLQENYRVKGANTWTVRWKVGDRPPFKDTYPNKVQAESFRSSLKVAAKNGEAFDLESGLPVSMKRSAKGEVSWYDFACKYAEMKWPDAAATTRRGTAEALMTATIAMIDSKRGMPEVKLLRSALFNWAFNFKHGGEIPDAIASALKWLRDNTRNVSSLAEAEVLRPVMDALARKVDGKSPVAATVSNRKRAVFFNALAYAVEEKLLDRNPIPLLKWKAVKVDHEMDLRSAVNPVQARTLLLAVNDVMRSGPMLMACYACSYYSGLRPEEAINVRKHNVTLPPLVWNREKEEWEEPVDEFGEFHLERAAPHAGSRWTNDGGIRDERGLKHRAETTVRPVPIPPELVKILRVHLTTFGTDSSGRLFRGERGGPVPVRLYNAVWRKARAATFTPDVLASPLAETPYDLRHAYMSTLLTAGIEPARVADWGGTSLAVLYGFYAKALHGRQQAALQRVLESLR